MNPKILSLKIKILHPLLLAWNRELRHADGNNSIEAITMMKRLKKGGSRQSRCHDYINTGKDDDSDDYHNISLLVLNLWVP